MEITLALFLAPSAALLAVTAVAARGGPMVGVHPRPRQRTSRPGLRRRIGSVRALRRLASGDRLAARLRAAGTDRSVEEIAGERWILATMALFLTSVAGVYPLALPAAALGFLIPEVLLSRAVRLRRSAMERELPLLLDVVAAATGAGLTGQLAVRRAAAATDGPLADELDATLDRIDLGGRWGVELEAMAERVALPDLHRAVGVLTRGEAVGSPLAEALTEIASESRDARRSVLAERARKAPVKMLFPLVFLVLPAFLLLTVVPVLVTTLESIH
jgi:pilus assembly protein TadC